MHILLFFPQRFHRVRWHTGCASRVDAYASAAAPLNQRPTLLRPQRHLGAVPKRTPRIVAIGGGTGLPSALKACAAQGGGWPAGNP